MYRIEDRREATPVDFLRDYADHVEGEVGEGSLSNYCLKENLELYLIVGISLL